MGKLAEVLQHPDELLPLMRIYAAHKRATQLPKDPELAFCYDMLNRVSRSFAIVIQQLPNPLRDAVCIFYLVLRGLDTVEDDMSIPVDVKVPALLDFHNKNYQRGFRMECGTGEYVRLMANYGTVVNVFLGLEQHFRDVIAEICKRMGAGMAEFIQREVVTVADYDLYCHYVAGLVGVGLSKLFASSGLETSTFATQETLSNEMGLFLQKTNIIRDYLEDILEEPAPRMFWPREIWGRYGDTLADFKERGPLKRRAALQCLNHMISDALRHVPSCLRYMQQLRHPWVFRFCAIPQIMAIGTLALCYNNGRVFEGVVKLRRGQTALVFDTCGSMTELYTWFLQFLDVLQRKAEHEVARDDPTVQAVRKMIQSHKSLCLNGLSELGVQLGKTVSLSRRALDYGLLTLAGLYVYHIWAFGDSSSTGVGFSFTHMTSREALQPLLSVLLLVFALHRAIAPTLQ